MLVLCYLQTPAEAGERETNHTKHLATIVSTVFHEFVMRYMHLSIVTKIKCRKR